MTETSSRRDGTDPTTWRDTASTPPLKACSPTPERDGHTLPAVPAPRPIVSRNSDPNLETVVDGDNTSGVASSPSLREVIAMPTAEEALIAARGEPDYNMRGL